MTDLLLLRSFLETAEAGAITPAARHLFVTQPALSRRLQQLEAELGVTLFERSARGVALTEEGRFVAREARDLIERYEHLRAGVAAISNLEVGKVRIGGGATAVSFVLPDAIAAFQRQRPGVLFQVKEAGSREVERDVADERLELGVVTLPIDPSLVGDFEVTPLVTDRMVLVAAKGHPFAKKKRISAKRLDGEDLVGFESPSAIRSLIDGALRDAGVRMNVVMELRSIPAILRMVATTGRLAFVSKLGIGHETDTANDVHALSVTGLSINRDLAIIRKANRPLSPVAAEFAGTLATTKP
ncbi:MAG: LysR family transcriptional regulator [Planctomycetota bacterium]|nr:LysR family transcriptional regulator [Planctomycetota bacterium]MDG2142874.1 LysR family transcriptional regulator [Planctomycetota bacterium]